MGRFVSAEQPKITCFFSILTRGVEQ